MKSTVPLKWWRICTEMSHSSSQLQTSKCALHLCTPLVRSVLQANMFASNWDSSYMWTSLVFRPCISPITFSVFMQSFLTRTSLKSQKIPHRPCRWFYGTSETKTKIKIGRGHQMVQQVFISRVFCRYEATIKLKQRNKLITDANRLVIPQAFRWVSFKMCFKCYFQPYRASSSLHEWSSIPCHDITFWLIPCFLWHNVQSTITKTHSYEHPFIFCHYIMSALLLHENSFISYHCIVPSPLLHEHSFISYHCITKFLVHFYMNTISWTLIHFLSLHSA